jgi:hypothetical protein
MGNKNPNGELKKMTATMTETTKVLARDLKVGDVILPPAREMRLWMRDTMEKEGLDESSMFITVTHVQQGKPDKNGAWLIVRGDGRRFLGTNGWRIRMRPDTLWPVVQRAPIAIEAEHAHDGFEMQIVPAAPAGLAVNIGEDMIASDLAKATKRTWTDHILKCRSCGDKFRASIEAIAEMRASYGSEHSDVDLANCLEFCLECADGEKVEGEKDGLIQPAGSTMTPIDYNNFDRENIAGLDQALYIASTFVGSSPKKEVAILCKVVGDREIYAVLDCPLMTFRNSKGVDMLNDGWKVTFTLRKPLSMEGK